MAKPAREVKLSKEDPNRDARLAQALRENLRRRKAQSRETNTPPETEGRKTDDA